MATFTAVYDACVLYPMTIRDVLMQLATTDLFRANRPQAKTHDDAGAANLSIYLIYYRW